MTLPPRGALATAANANRYVQEYRADQASVITSKAANDYHFKTDWIRNEGSSDPSIVFG
jgi:hypothetical protein